MLAIRFLRSGRRNRAFFRVVLTEKSRPPKSNFIKELGWFDPHSKEVSLNKEEILRCLDNGAKPSNSVAKLLLANKIEHKQIVFIPDAPKAKKTGKNDSESKPTDKKEEEATKQDETISDSPEEEKDEEKPAENSEAEAKEEPENSPTEKNEES